VDRDRDIEVLGLAMRIEAEQESGRVGDADVSDEQARKLLTLLMAPAAAGGQPADGDEAGDQLAS
jgi:hypothetical protein